MKARLPGLMPLACAALLLGAAAKPPAHKPVPKPHPQTSHTAKPHSHPQKPAAAAAPPPAPEPLQDLSHALPAKDVLKLPSTKEQFETLKTKIVHDRPAVIDARQKSDKLKAEAQELQRKLIATAARVVDLETEKAKLDTNIAQLESDDTRLSADFARDRVSVEKLLAILERMQHDMPPALVLRPDDALGAARSAMLIGASAPNVYQAAAALAKRIVALQHTRAALIERRAEGVRNATKLRAARTELDQLLATKQLESDAAASRYGDLETHLAEAATAAADLQALLAKVAMLRKQPGQQNVVEVTAQKGGPPGALLGRTLLKPVAGAVVPGGMDGVGGSRAPGLTFAVSPGARVIAPADSEILFAGPYHKTGYVLILELTAGYDLVLAGLGRVDVRPNDEVLAGEPVGIMPKSGQDVRLYFELRQNGHGTSPAPWMAADLRKAQRS